MRDKVFDEDDSSMRESSRDRLMRKKEAIRSREKNVQSIHSVEENYLSCFAHTGEEGVDVDDMKKRLKETEEEVAAVHEMQAKVESHMVLQALTWPHLINFFR